MLTYIHFKYLLKTYYAGPSIGTIQVIQVKNNFLKVIII